MYKGFGTDEIRIEKLEVYAYHGVYPQEKSRGQTFYVNAALYTDIRKAAAKDDLALSVDYGDVCTFISQWMKDNKRNLLETVAEDLSEAILLRYPLVFSVDLEIRKPEAPIDQPFGCVSVKINRGWHRAYLGLGSNLGEKESYLDGAVLALREHPLIREVRESKRIETAPYGGIEQDNFLNSVLRLDTLLGPEELLEVLHGIENAAGRERTVRWGPRTLDLDILFYDRLVYESDDLVIPHPDLENRDFVLRPLETLAPNYRHPVSGKTVSRLLQELSGK
ncbi:MAG: 2-amino-4-hydroxy-6-hydroxymethyldihydropteridine diphosphokinase [bacterium]|nr:2-amino-4-hydroxy-6-hydroxymethyldihydropteridine diphosphokinase [bacterium]